MAYNKRSYSITVLGPSGITITPNSFNFSINLGRNQPASWTLQMSDPTGAYAGSVLDPASGKEFSAIVTGGATFTTPILLPTRKSWNAAAKNGYHLSLSGTDSSRKLMVRNQTMASQTSVLGNVLSAQTLAEYICITYGLTPDMAFTDYEIMKWMFQATTPMEKLLELFGVVFAEWIITSNNVMNVYDQFGGPDSGLTFNASNCSVIEETVEDIQVINRVQVIRTRAVKNYGEKDVTAPGRYEIPFSQPVYYPHYSTPIEINGGWYKGAGADAITFFHADDTWDYTGSGATPYVKAYATFLVNPTTPWHGKIEFDGISASEAAILSSFDQTYDVTVNDLPSQAIYGIQPADTPITNVLIPNATIAQLHGERYILEANRRLRTYSFQPRVAGTIILPCRKAVIEEPVGGIDGNIYIETANITVTPRGLSNTFTAVVDPT